MANHFVNIAQQNLQQLKPEQRQKIQRFLTPQFATVAGVLFGDEVKDFLDSVANPEMQSFPVPKKAVVFLGEDKINKFFQKAAEDADLIEQEQMAAQPQAQEGFAAPEQQQQAPVSPPAPTGFINQPQTPNTQSPITENALSTGNPVIQ